MFLAAVARTGCVRSAADACGFSTTALYNRRRHYPDFAARWGEAEAMARERLPVLLTAAAIAGLDPEIADAELPPVNVDQAIRICTMKGWGGASAPPPIEEEPIEAVRARILERIERIEAARARNAED